MIHFHNDIVSQSQHYMLERLPSIQSIENIVPNEIDKKTAKMYIMKSYVSLHDFINHAE